MPERTCAVEVCDRPVLARGWCSPHYQRWRKHGDPGTSAIRVEYPAWIERVCIRCGATFTIPPARARITRTFQGQYCSRDCYHAVRSEDAQRWGIGNSGQISVGTASKVDYTNCPECGRLITVHGKRLAQLRRGASICCGVDCLKLRKTKQNRETWRRNYERTAKPLARINAARRRARKATAEIVERIDPTIVAARDNHRCHLCGHKVNPNLPWPHLKSATIDHLVPIAR